MEILETKKATQEKEIDLPTKIKATVTKMGNGAHIYVPVSWCGKNIIAQLLEE